MVTILQYFPFISRLSKAFNEFFVIKTILYLVLFKYASKITVVVSVVFLTWGNNKKYIKSLPEKSKSRWCKGQVFIFKCVFRC